MLHMQRTQRSIGALRWWIRHLSSTTPMEVSHDTEQREFSIGRGSQKAVLQYKIISPDAIELEHTIVPDSLQGQGIGKKLAEAALQHAVDKHLRVKVSCDYVGKYLEKNSKPEIEKMLIK